MQFDPKTLIGLPPSEIEERVPELVAAEKERLLKDEPLTPLIVTIEIVEGILKHYRNLILKECPGYSWSGGHKHVAFAQRMQWDGENLTTFTGSMDDADFEDEERFNRIIQGQARVAVSYAIVRPFLEVVFLQSDDKSISLVAAPEVITKRLSECEDEEDRRRFLRRLLGRSFCLGCTAQLVGADGSKGTPLSVDLSRTRGVWKQHSIEVTVSFHHLIIDERDDSVFIPARVDIRFYDPESGNEIDRPDLTVPEVVEMWQWIATEFENLKESLQTFPFPPGAEKAMTPQEIADALCSELSIDRLNEVIRSVQERARLDFAFVEQDKSKDSKETLGSVSVPADFPTGDPSWEEVSIEFLSEDIIRVRVRDIQKEHHFSDTDFADKRSKTEPKPNRLWPILRLLAAKHGEIKFSDLGPAAQDQLKSDMRRLRRALKNLLSIEADPFQPFRRFHSYRARFSIR